MVGYLVRLEAEPCRAKADEELSPQPAFYGPDFLDCSPSRGVNVAGAVKFIHGPPRGLAP